MRLANWIGGLANFVEHAVGTEAHPVGLFVGLEVQVGRAAADGVEQHLVDEAHHRGIFGIVAAVVLAGAFRLADIDPVEIDVTEVAESVHSALVELLDGYAELVVLHQQGFGGETGAELDIGDRLVVGRVGETDEQFVAAFPQRQHTVLADQALADDILRNAFPIQAVQVAIGDAELLGGHLDQRPALHQLAWTRWLTSDCLLRAACTWAWRAVFSSRSSFRTSCLARPLRGVESFIGEHLKKAWSETYNADAWGCQTDDSGDAKSVTYCRQGRAEHFRSPRKSCERRAFERLACNLL